MAKWGALRRPVLVVFTIASLSGFLTIGTAQAVTSASASAASTVTASPYFAGAVTTLPPPSNGGYTESTAMSFVVPTLTCPSTGTVGYSVFQYLQAEASNQSESTYSVAYVYCSAGRFAASLATNSCVEYNSQCSGACGTGAGIDIAAGDTITFGDSASEIDNGEPGTLESEASDSTNESSIECESGIAPGYFPFDGPVYTGVCGFATSGRVPMNAPPPPPFEETCVGSGKIPGSSPLSLSDVQLNGKSIWGWKTHEYDMYRYRKMGSGLKPIEQIQTQKAKKAMVLTFLHR